MKVLTFFPFIFQVTWPLERGRNTKPEFSIYEYSIHNWLFFQKKKLVLFSRHFTKTTWIHWRKFEFADLFDFTRTLLNLIFKIFSDNIVVSKIRGNLSRAEYVSGYVWSTCKLNNFAQNKEDSYMCCGRNRVASPLLIDRLLKYDLCDASLRCLLLVPIFLN